MKRKYEIKHFMPRRVCTSNYNLTLHVRYIRYYTLRARKTTTLIIINAKISSVANTNIYNDNKQHIIHIFLTN